MKATSLFLVVVYSLLLSAAEVRTRDVAVPAGTLLQCTLSEPNFSSATTSVGDPFLCYPRSVQEFGQTVFPRGTYLVGHLEDAKEPGHFVGKGYLKMAIDRLGLPASDIPLSAKVIAVSGYRVDKEGKVIGKGHAKRDIVEWCLPPLWPWKILTLPARGPRPTLKGEVRLTLRVMDDFVVPQTVADATPPRRLLPDRPMPEGEGWHHFGEPARQKNPPASPESDVPVLKAVNESQTIETPAPVEQPATLTSQQQPAAETDNATAEDWPANVTVFALTDGTMVPAKEYWRDQDNLIYVPAEGGKSTIALNSIDWSMTTRVNSQRNVRVTLRNAARVVVPGN